MESHFEETCNSTGMLIANDIPLANENMMVLVWLIYVNLTRYILMRLDNGLWIESIGLYVWVLMHWRIWVYELKP